MTKTWNYWNYKAITDIWTGDKQRREDRLIPTGIMGSLRWWFEVLVRGLGGKACDPTVEGVRCPENNKQLHEPGHHCVVCELFGCTGWARKFRLMVLDENGQRVIQDQIQVGQKFTLRFIPLRTIAPEEWCLLDATLHLIADYGAMGGKTVFKPSKEWGIADLGADGLDDSNNQIRVQRSHRGLPLQQGDIILEVEGIPVNSKSQLQQLLVGKHHGERIAIKVRRRNGTEEEIEGWAGKRHHQAFGLVKYVRGPEGWQCEKTLEDIRAYVTDGRWRQVPYSYPDNQGREHDFSWASLQNFWYVKGRYLARQDANTSSFNFVIGRPEPKSQSSQGDSWLAGRRPNRQRGIKPESKKVFSFKEPKDACRTFGFVQNEQEFSRVLNKLKTLRDGGNGRQPDRVWDSFNLDSEFLKGEQILERLFQ